MTKHDEFLASLKDVKVQETSSKSWLLITNESTVVSTEDLMNQFDANGFLVNEGNERVFHVAKLGV